MRRKNKPIQKSFIKKVLFLDLEDTVIDDFTQGLAARPCNHEQVKNFVRLEAPDEVRLFSFAIDNAHDVKVFDKFFRNWLNQSLDLTIQTEDIFTVETLVELCRKENTVFDDLRECKLFHGKSYGFQRYIELSPQFNDCDVILVDDMVEPMRIQYPERNLTLRMVNVASLA